MSQHLPALRFLRKDDFSILLCLPPFLEVEGVEFEFSLWIESPREARMAYKLRSVAYDSPHWHHAFENNCWINPFFDGASQNFLWLAEGIDSSSAFRAALLGCKEFLKKNQLV